MAKYLNLSGLQTLWTKLKNTFATKSHKHNAVDIVNVDLSKMNTTIAAQIKARYPAQYIRMSTNSNGDASNISDKPKSGWSFFAEASLVKNGGSSDYTYIVHAYSAMRKSSSDETNVADTNGYICEVGPLTTSCVWKRLLEPSDETYEQVGSDTQIPVITTNEFGQIIEMHTVTVKGGEGGSDPGSTYAKLASYNTFTQTQEIKRTNNTKAQLIIRNNLRDLRIGVDANGQFFFEDYADRQNSKPTTYQFIVSEGTGDETVFRFNGIAELASNLTTNGKTQNVIENDSRCLTSGGAYSYLLMKGNVGGFFVYKSTVKKQFYSNAHTWINLSLETGANHSFVMPKKSRIILTLSIVGMNPDESFSPATPFKINLYCGNSQPPANGSMQYYISTIELVPGINKIIPLIADNDTDEPVTFFLWAKPNGSYDVKHWLGAGSLWGNGLYGNNFWV